MQHNGSSVLWVSLLQRDEVSGSGTGARELFDADAGVCEISWGRLELCFFFLKYYFQNGTAVHICVRGRAVDTELTWRNHPYVLMQLQIHVSGDVYIQVSGIWDGAEGSCWQGPVCCVVAHENGVGACWCTANSAPRGTAELSTQ